MDQAHESIKEVEINIENNLLRVAINRIYYGMFYILLVLALKNNFKTSKHGQLIGWFNKNFIKEGLIDKRYGTIITNAFEARWAGDYGVLANFNKEEVEIMFEDMKDFISTIEKQFLNN